MVEYNDYDIKVPVVHDFYQHEIVVKPKIGDCKCFFEGRE